MITRCELKKYFSEKKYGFIECPGMDEDIYFRGEKPEGERYASFDLIKTPLGMRAKNFSWLKELRNFEGLHYNDFPMFINENGKILCGYDTISKTEFKVGTLFDGTAIIRKDAIGGFAFFSESECRKYGLREFIEGGAREVISAYGRIEIIKENDTHIKLNPSGKFFEIFTEKCNITFENTEAEKRCKELGGELSHTLKIIYDLVARQISITIIYKITYKCLDEWKGFDHREYAVSVLQTSYGSMYEEFFPKSASREEMYPYERKGYTTKHEYIYEEFAMINVEDEIECLFDPFN